MANPRIVAHRGWRTEHLENTLGAISAAVASGCRAVEFDVRRTLDHEWIVYHDPDLSRLHGSPLVIADHEVAQIRSLAPVVTLDEALDVFGETCLPMIEVKQPETDGIESLCEIIGRRDYPRVVICRGPEMPRALSRRLPDVSVFLYTRDWEEALARREEVAGFDLWHEGIEVDDAPQIIARLQEDGREVAVWTVNGAELVQRWLAAGASWVITDHPWEIT